MCMLPGATAGFTVSVPGLFSNLGQQDKATGNTGTVGRGCFL